MKKTQVIVVRALAAGLAVLTASAAIAACSGDNEETGQGGGSSVSASSVASSSAGTGGGEPDAGANPLEQPCNSLCGYLASIQCTAWPNCSTECADGFDAPAECADEVQALIECWLENKSSFTCSATQLIPPAACQALEAAFNTCFSGSNPEPMDGGMPVTCAAGQTKNATDTTCSAKTPCDDGTEVKSACALPDGAQTWTCSCYKGKNLLGTCSGTENVCENHVGCCASFFFPGGMP